MELLILIAFIGVALTRIHDIRLTGNGSKSEIPVFADELNGLQPSTDTSINFDDDLFTNPMYSHIPGNIYYHSQDDMFSSIANEDLCTNPAYSYLACNIYHRDDDWNTTGSSFDCTSSPWTLD